MKFIIHDITGTVPQPRTEEDDDSVPKARGDYLLELLREKQVSAEPLEGLLPETIKPAEDVVLVHKADMGSVKGQVEALAEQGSLVVIYSGGQVTEQENPKGTGWLYWRRWDSVEEAVNSLPKGFGLRDLKNVLDSPPQRSLLAAVAILSWCASAQVGDGAVLQRQKQWRDSPERWRQVFEKIDKKSFLQAVGPGMTDPQSWPSDLSEVGRLVDWAKSTAGGTPAPPAPDHKLVLEQLQGRFRWKL